MKNDAMESQTFAAEMSNKELDTIIKENDSKVFSKIKLNSITILPID